MHATNYMSCPVSGFGIFPRIEILSRLDWVKYRNLCDHHHLACYEGSSSSRRILRYHLKDRIGFPTLSHPLFALEF